MSRTPDNHNPESPRPNRRFRDDLAALYRPAGTVPAEVDEAIRRRVAGEIRRRAWIRRAFDWTIIGAAAALFAAMLWPDLSSVRSSPGGPRTRTPDAELAHTAPPGNDFNADGRTDIRDAYLLARATVAGEAVGETWDLNGDGEVNRRDADLIAAAAVRLPPGAAARTDGGGPFPLRVLVGVMP